MEGGGSVSLSTRVLITDKVSSTSLSIRDREVGRRWIHLLEDSSVSLIAEVVPFEPTLNETMIYHMHSNV